jgi:hypothetical protein
MEGSGAVVRLRGEQEARIAMNIRVVRNLYFIIFDFQQ